MNNFNIDLDNTIDDDFFGSLKESKSSKLQQLFVEDALSSGDKQQSLKYQRPKDIPTTSISTSTTLIAKVVTVYKQGELQGKVGLALIQNPDASCNIIMYKTKAHILVTLKLQPGKDLLYKQTKYWQFYDETSTYWSFSFDNTDDEKDFMEQLCNNSISFKESEVKRVEEKHLELPNIASDDKCSEVEDYEGNAAAKETKHSLMKRVAKMGRPLPTLSSNQQTTTEFSDSSDTEVIHTPLTSSQKPTIAPRSNKLMSNKPNHQLVSSIVGLNSVAGSVFPINHLESQYMQMLLTEQRTQGSEIRMNINKLENKIEKVLDILELHGRNDGKQKIEKDDEILELEEKLLMLKKENRKLKQNSLQTTSEEPKDNTIQQMVYEFKEDFRYFNIDYNQSLKHILFELFDKLKENNTNMKKLQEKIYDNEQKLEKLKSELEHNIKKTYELKTEISLLNQKENELKNQLNEREAEALQRKQELLDLQNKSREKSQETLRNPNDALIKSIMNNLYVDIADRLNNTDFLHSEQILPLIASAIKEQTLKSLQQSGTQNHSN